MLLIPCPYCAEKRPEVEFHYGGEAHIARPQQPQARDDDSWADYVFMRTNTKGWHAERWVHTAGCRRWFNVVRNTITHEILASYRVGEEKPPIDETRAQNP